MLRKCVGSLPCAAYNVLPSRYADALHGLLYHPLVSVFWLLQEQQFRCRCHCCILTARSDYFAALLSRSELCSSDMKDQGGDAGPSSQSG